jgi:hypothetical protein
MSVVQTIADRLRDNDPSLSTRVECDTITVEPRDQNGFPVWLSVEGGSYTVGFDGWHEEFDSEEEALNCFAFGLSADCRLKVVFRGKLAHRWTVESKTNGAWREDSTTGLLVFPFWRRPHVVYKTNGRKPVTCGL